MLSADIVIILPYRNETLAIALENWKKSGIKLSLERPNLLDFVNLSQIFFDGL